MTDVDYKAKCEELSKTNIELSTKNAELTKSNEGLKGEVKKWRDECTATVHAHNSVKEQTQNMLTDLLFNVKNTKMLTPDEVDARNKALAEQLAAQAAAAKPKPQ